MPYDPAEHHRHSIRLPGFDYSKGGAYFITICTHAKECILGQIGGGQAVLSERGRIVSDCWADIPKHYPGVMLDEFVVMPNHVHGVVWFETGERLDAGGMRAGPAPPLLGNVIGSFKSASTRRINQSLGVQGALVWQRNYFEHVVRDEESLSAIRQYIRTNPQRWHQDAENPQGDRSDDVEAWTRQVAEEAAVRRVEAAKRRPENQERVEGGACPAPTLSSASLAKQERAGHAPPLRVGHGYDIHRVRLGGRLMLAGVAVADDMSAVAHSDGDVVLHAVVDAVLGALGRGDIGEMFPNTDPQWRGADSRVFVEAAMAEARSAGYRVVNADVTVLAERPKLKAFKAEMARNLGQLLECPVNIKAGTNESCDAIGRGEAVACHAVVLLAGGGSL
jgi:2-C-methyl-D-erythritol 2,4-cyclodiphosphate synthase